jgi:phospholipid/cholesterol/gamma-HCH transport system permease protein
MNLFASIGKRTVDTSHALGDFLAFLGETTWEGLAALFIPRRFRFGDCALAFQRAAFDALPIATLIGFLLGLILAFQSAAALQMFGVESYVANMLAIALFRELGPLVTAIILAGRSGSAFAAEIGTMKVNEELNALTTMGLPPVRFLVLPRIVAAVLAMPILTIFAELAGLIGGAIVLELMNVPNVVYWRNVANSSSVFNIAFGLGKGALFGLLVALVACAAGMRTKDTADGVGTAATSAVVSGIIAIALADGLLAVLCHIWGI